MNARIARIVSAALVTLGSLALFADTATFEGVVRSVDPDVSRVVIVTGSEEIVAVWGSEDTPVRFEGSTYRIRNLEVGDRISMTVSGTGDERRVAAIDVLVSVSPSDRPAERSEPGPAPEPEPVELEEGVTLTSVSGKVDQTRPDRNLIRIIAEGGLSWVRIDATSARTPDGSPFKVSELRFGEMIEAVGRIGNNGEIVATVIRRESELTGGTPAPAMLDFDEGDDSSEEPEAARVYVPRRIQWLDLVEFEGEIVLPLDGAQTLTIRNDVTGNDEVVWCDASLVAMSDGDPIPATDLETGMRVEVTSFRVSEGLIVQAIRVEED